MRHLGQRLLLIHTRLDGTRRDSAERCLLFSIQAAFRVDIQSYTHSSDNMKDNKPVKIVATDQAAFQL